MARRGVVCDSFCLAVPSLHGHWLALPAGLWPSWHQDAAGGAAGWSFDGDRGPVLCRADDPGEPVAILAGDGGDTIRDPGDGVGVVLPRLYDPLRPYPARDERDREPDVCARSAESQRDLSAAAADRTYAGGHF